MTKKKTVAPRREMTRKELSRVEREARWNRWIIGSAVAVGVFVVGLLVYGYVAEVLIAGRQPVAYVDGQTIRTTAWQARVREVRSRLLYELALYRTQRMFIDSEAEGALEYLQQLEQEIRNLESQLSPIYAESLGQQVLEQMAQEALIRQEAERLGLSVSSADVDRAIERFFGYERPDATSALLDVTTPLTETETLTPTGMTEEDFELRYQDYTGMLSTYGVRVETFRESIEASLLTNLVQTAMEAEVATTADQIQLRYLSSPDEDAITEALARLDAGEEWDAIVAEIEADEESLLLAADVDWRTEAILTQQFGPEVAEAVWQVPVGSYVGPLVGSSERFYIMQVLGHEVRELDEFFLAYERSMAFYNWLMERMEQVEYVDGWQANVPTDPAP